MTSLLPTTPGAAEQRVNFLNLMITQLRNQNPLEPLDNNQMASQLAQLSQLEQTEQMNSTFKDVLLLTEAKYAASLMGKQVSWLPKGQTYPLSGRVTAVEQSGGEVHLRIGNDTVAVKDVLSITE
jgi:flagellar basal-body rod modification protein FlgD